MSAGTPLAELAWREIVAQHAFFEAWMRGDLPEAAFPQCEASMAPGFRMVTPDGRSDGLAGVLAWIRGARGSRAKDATILALDPRTIWAGDGAVLLEYTEQQYRDGRTTRRRSTALFLANPSAPRGVEWLHVQETWMDGG